MNVQLKWSLSPENRSGATKTEIIQFLAQNGKKPVKEIAKDRNISIPTAIKFIDGLIKENIVLDLGKQHHEGGRMPNIYGLNPDIGYFVGVEMKRHSIAVGVMDFTGQIIYSESDIQYVYESSESIDDLCGAITTSLSKGNIGKSSIIAYCISIPGRVRTHTGDSFNYFSKLQGPLDKELEERLKATVYIDNDSRIMCYGEYIASNLSSYKNILYINISWGLGMGMVIDGKLYYGATGFAGELGHFPLFDNEIFCRCGKKGCLETEASGLAMHRLLVAKHNVGARSILSPKIESGETIRLEDFIDAVKQGDTLMIEIVEEIGNKLGKGLAGMINVFNPELVIIGGTIAETGEYLLMSTISSIRRYSLNIVNKETHVILSSAGKDAGIIGACRIARDRSICLLQ